MICCEYITRVTDSFIDCIECIVLNVLYRMYCIECIVLNVLY